jgi:hypothetical protein
MGRRGRLAGAAFAGLVLLIASWGCDDTREKVGATQTVAAPATAGVAATVGSAVKLDVAPSAAVAEKRWRQERVGSQLVIDTKGRWEGDCLVHRGCPVKPHALEVCPSGSDAPLWSTLPGKAEHFTDPRVAVRGQLVMADSGFSSAVACKAGQCCNGVRVNIVLAGPPYDLELVGLGCAGDESRQCCPFSARGEEVIASGILNYGNGRLSLTSPKLCRTTNN